jgi:hypothetical protein
MTTSPLALDADEVVTEQEDHVKASTLSDRAINLDP